MLYSYKNTDFEYNYIIEWLLNQYPRILLKLKILKCGGLGEKISFLLLYVILFLQFSGVEKR